MSIFRLPKVATPPDAAVVTVLEPPSNVPLLSVRVTVEVSVVTTLSYTSSTLTVTAGLIGVPAVLRRLLAEDDLGRRRRADPYAVGDGRCQVPAGEFERDVLGRVVAEVRERGHASYDCSGDCPLEWAGSAAERHRHARVVVAGLDVSVLILFIDNRLSRECLTRR